MPVVSRVRSVPDPMLPPSPRPSAGGRESARPAVGMLVAAAVAGDEGSWDALVERFSVLVGSTCRRHRLSPHDADEVSQQVWLRLIEGLATLREPEALPGWLLTTTRRECLRVYKGARREVLVDFEVDLDPAGDLEETAPEQALLASDREDVVRQAVAQLRARDRALVALLFADPPLSYSEIGRRLGMPVGSIGPTRSRCLSRLRRHPAVRALADTGAAAVVPSAAA